MERNELSDRFATYIFSLVEGDVHMIEDMYALLHKYGYCDKDGFEVE